MPAGEGSASGNALRIETVVEGDDYVVRLFGELDLSGFDRVLGAVGAATGPAVIIDLRGVTFIDSSGIRSLLAAERQVGDAGGSVGIVRGAPDVHRVFTLTGLDGSLPFIDRADPHP